MKNIKERKCWCGSGLQYGRCHMEFDKRMESLAAKDYILPPREIIKNKKEIEMIKKSCDLNNSILDEVEKKIHKGMSTLEIDEIVHNYTVSHGGIPAPLNFRGFPKSVCVSINDEVCHGIPSADVILKEGDIVNVDVSTILDGYYSDASRMFIIGKTSDNAKRLVEVSKRCMEEGIKAIKPWGFLGDIGYAVNKCAIENGYTVVDCIGGHGVGNEFHEEPYVPFVGEKGTGMILVPGMIITIEPMINEGTNEVFVDEDDDWTVLTDDGLLSAQWENTILITEDGVEILAK